MPIIAVVATLSAALGGRGPAPAKPRLVVMITVDQLRPDYLTRWRTQLTGGFRLLQAGAVFTNAFQDHGVTETAPGHATLLSGRWPAHTGIMTNALGVIDSSTTLLVTGNPGASPKRFRGTALFDWLRATSAASRALSVSRKDRGAILPIGSARQEVYWYDAGLFTTSTFYRDSLPLWVRAFNGLRIPFKAAGHEYRLLLPDSAYAEPDSVPWESGGHGVTFPHYLPTDSARAALVYPGVSSMDSLTLAFALSGAEAMRLGRGDVTDLLAVSLSTTDAIGHTFGPDSREIHDQVLRLDRYLAWFLGRLFDRYGRDKLLIVLTADHGVTPYPDFSRLHGHPQAQFVNVDTLLSAVNQQLDHVAGAPAPRDWFVFDPGILFLRDNGRLAALGYRTDSIVDVVARRLRAVAGVARVDTPAAIAAADTVADPIARRWLHHLSPDAGAALVVTLAEWNAWGWPSGIQIAEHGQPSDLDAHVPLILWGPGLRGGIYGARANTVDIAPTLARVLGLSPLSLVDGRVLSEAIDVR
ncbi:MAG TPA: alkaline phosphatase family protein [Gemmatimonadales bacterium]|nr:alkaline phosphatase family protein [Gemmatimonadales bacterium]